MAGERFLVTGALGCIGAWTVRTLREQDFEVIALNRSLSLDRLRLVMEREDLDDITFEQCDITDRDALERAFERHQPTHVIHLAALQIPFCRADPSLGAAVNVQGTINVFEAVKARRDAIAPLVYSGSVAMYAERDAGEVRRNEDAEPHPTTHYGVYKWANERAAQIYWDEAGVSSIALRPMVVFGAGRDQGLTSGSTLAMRAAALGESFRIPHGGSSFFNYAPDVARTFVSAALSSSEGARRYNVPGTIVSIPEVVAAIQATVDGAGVEFEGDGLPFPYDIAASGVAAVADTNVTPFQQAVGETVEHFRRVAALT